jgi:hypothetical protein
MTLIQPFDGIREIGITELVGINEEVNTNDFGGSVEVDVSPGTQNASGEFLAFAFFATEDGSGAVQDSQGELLLFDADPNPTVGDTALTAAEWLTLVGRVKVSASDWTTDANGGVAYIDDQPIPFHQIGSLYAVWFHTDSTDLNDAGGDDEQLEFNAWYVRYS